MVRGRSEWIWDAKEGKGRDRALRRSAHMLTRDIVSTGYVPFRGSKLP
jgi:hypothetical protein